jgi:hypothetical protein
MKKGGIIMKKIILLCLFVLISLLFVQSVTAETFSASFEEGCIGCLHGITQADTVIGTMPVQEGTIQFTIDTKVLPRRKLGLACGPTDFWYRGWDDEHPDDWKRTLGEVIQETGTPKSSSDPNGTCGIEGQQHIEHLVTRLKLDHPILLEVAMDPSIESHGGGPKTQYGQQKEITINYEVVGEPAGSSVTQAASQSPFGCSFAGIWDTDWGMMTLTQSGSQVTGSYPHDNGRFSGSVSGSTVRGTWSESPSYTPPNDAGDVELTLSSDCNSFTGRWRYGTTGKWGSSASWDGSWSGTKIMAMMVSTTESTAEPLTSMDTTTSPAATATPATAGSGKAPLSVATVLGAFCAVGLFLVLRTRREI